MPKTYGNKGNPRPIPDWYNEETQLFFYKETQYTNAKMPIAEGKWTSKGFTLKYGSLIVEDDKNEQYVKDIKKDLEHDEMLECNNDLGDYSLRGDVVLHSPATACALVDGRNSNGYIRWRNADGVKLGHLLEPDNPDYF